MTIIGGGPGGYEAALVARQLGADVTVVDRDGPGGSAVLTDCVPSKALIATANVLTEAGSSADLGVQIHGLRPDPSLVGVDLCAVNLRIQALAAQQSADIRSRLEHEGIAIIDGTGRFDEDGHVVANGSDGTFTVVESDVTLISTGARPRVLPGAIPDGERILTWE